MSPSLSTMKNLLLASSLVRPYLLFIAFLMVRITPLPALPAPATTILYIFGVKTIPVIVICR